MASLTSTSGIGGILPEDYGPLIVEPVTRDALAFDQRLSTTVSTADHQFHVPVVRTDAAANWVTEGAEITPADPTLDEIVVTPAKVAGLTIISRELAEDSSPAAAQIVGDGLARSIVEQVDKAFFGKLAAPAPSGLDALPTTGAGAAAAVSGALTSADVFAAAIAQIELAGGTPSAFVLAPADALTLSTIKTITGSTQPMLGMDAANGTARQVLGVPVLVSKHVTTGTAWALDGTRQISVLREGTTLTVDSSAYFSSDRIGVRATLRVGFAYPTPTSIVKITFTAP